MHMPTFNPREDEVMTPTLNRVVSYYQLTPVKKVIAMDALWRTLSRMAQIQNHLGIFFFFIIFKTKGYIDPVYISGPTCKLPHAKKENMNSKQLSINIHILYV